MRSEPTPVLGTSFEPPVPSRVRRARVAALDDSALIAAMRADDPYAWAEFDARFRPALRAFAARVKPSGDLTDADVTDALVDELLAESATRLTGPNAPTVLALHAYLLRSARSRLFNLRRGSARRVRHVSEAAEATDEGAAMASEYAVRHASGPAVMRDAPVPDDESPAVRRLADALRAATTTDEQMILTWVAQRVPHRQIAEWLAVGYDAATKRIWRLCRRLRGAAVRHVETLAPAERREVERFLRRAGALPPLVARTVQPVDDHG